MRVVTSNGTDLLDRLSAHYRSSGWKVERAEDGTLRAAGPGGVTWVGTAVRPDDVASDELEDRLTKLADQRMPQSGELCPLDVVVAEDAESGLRGLLDRTGLSARPHVSVYSLATG